MLIVDDEPHLVSTIERMLRRDFTVASVNDGENALAVLRLETFDLVLCDLSLPSRDGMDVFRTLVAEENPVADRILFLTGGATTKEGDDFLRAHPDRVVLKPFRQEDLLARIKSFFMLGSAT